MDTQHIPGRQPTGRQTEGRHTPEGDQTAGGAGTLDALSADKVAPTRAPVARLGAIHKAYGQRVALAGVSFDVHAGEVLGLLGPNGAGKTTTLSILATLLRPDAGSLEVTGVDALQEPSRVRPSLGVVPQELALYPTLSCEANLRFFGGIYGISGAALAARVAHLLDVCGLRERGRDRVATLSGGMRRRLNLAVALVHEPRLLLLDEPTVGVDPHSRNFLLTYLSALRERGMAIVYCTHYMEEAERICDRVAILDEGAVLALGTRAELLRVLGGGIVRVAFTGDHQEDGAQQARAAEELGALPGVRAAHCEGGRYKLLCEEPTRAVAAVAQYATSRGLGVRGLELLPVNLETLFLHLTGHSLRDE